MKAKVIEKADNFSETRKLNLLGWLKCISEEGILHSFTHESDMAVKQKYQREWLQRITNETSYL